MGFRRRKIVHWLLLAVAVVVCLHAMILNGFMRRIPAQTKPKESLNKEFRAFQSNGVPDHHTDKHLVSNSSKLELFKTLGEAHAMIPRKKTQSGEEMHNRGENHSTKVHPTLKRAGNKLILAWTSLTNKKPLWGIKPYSFRHCVYRNCEITSNRSRLNDSDLLLFRIRQLPTTQFSLRPYVRQLDFRGLPPSRPMRQIWMEVNEESPMYTHSDEEVAPLNNLFNVSVTYLMDSDFPLSYIPIVKLKRQPSNNSIDYSAGKTKMALWFVSHCNASSGRDRYVKELEKYGVKVDIYGKCSRRRDVCAPSNITCSKELRMKYKFYLAFENSICKEYITEKFWNTLKSDSYNIPIALGASMNEYERFAPPNSYLHTRNFTTVKHLAEFMKKLDSDNKAFNSYHKWRETHWIEPRSDGKSLHCYMCRQANEKKDGNTKYKTLSSYWSRLNNCETRPEPIE